MSVTLRVDDSLCRGTGLCHAMAPELFRQVGDGTAEPVEPEIDGTERVAIAQDVADCCPTGAVTVTTNERRQR